MAADPLNIATIVSYLKSRITFVPDIAIVCGSGLAGLTNIIEGAVSVAYTDIPGFPRSTVEGHGNELVFGTLHGRKVVAMKGRFHFYEGYEPAKVAVGVRVFAALGIKVLLVTNAAGGVNSSYNVGDVMIIEDHISMPGLAGVHPLVGPNDARFGPRFPAVTNVYTPALRDVVATAAGELGMSSFIRRGVYFGVSGPNYETRHEIGLMRLLGGDAVGMSTVPEVLVAAHCGMQVLGLSLITNRCVAPGDDIIPPTHEEVLAATEARKADLQKLVASVIGKLDASAFPVPKAAAAFEAAAAAKPACPCGPACKCSTGGAGCGCAAGGACGSPVEPKKGGCCKKVEGGAAPGGGCCKKKAEGAAAAPGGGCCKKKVEAAPAAAAPSPMVVALGAALIGAFIGVQAGLKLARK